MRDLDEGGTVLMVPRAKSQAGIRAQELPGWSSHSLASLTRGKEPQIGSSITIGLGSARGETIPGWQVFQRFRSWPRGPIQTYLARTCDSLRRLAGPGAHQHRCDLRSRC